jgi:glycine/D-amino acid oxidase-like deaminating enzyme
MLPKRADILVIGGGLAGCGVAYHLSKAGADVVLVERFDLNTQASGCNSGSIHAQIPFEPFAANGEAWAERFGPTLPLMIRSIEAWGGLSAELGEDLDVSTRGGLLVARTEEQMRFVEAKAAVERRHGLEVEVIGRNALRDLAPYVSDDMIGGAFCAIEGKANPLLAAPAFARAAERHGARVLRRVSVAGIAREGAGWRVATSAGEIVAGRVVNCAGAEAGRIAAMVDVDLPVEAHPIQSTVTEPVGPLVPHLLYSADEKLSLKQTKQGTLLIGGGWPADLDGHGRPVVNMRSLVANMRVALGAVPALGGVQVVRSWAAIVNGTADWRPILGEAPKAKGVFLAFFPWMGFTAGPFVARAVADMVLGRPAEMDLSAFAPG